MTHPGVELHQVRYDDPETVALVEEIQLDLTGRYGGPDETPVDPGDFVSPDGIFLVLRRGGAVAACAGLRRHGNGVVELKRMFVRPAYRRTGLARVLIAALEDNARAAGYRQLVLETGTGQPEAMALYESAGFERIPPFGFYAEHVDSRSYGKTL